MALNLNFQPSSKSGTAKVPRTRIVTTITALILILVLSLSPPAQVEGAPLELCCLVDSDPMAAVTWYKNDLIFMDDARDDWTKLRGLADLSNGLYLRRSRQA